ncbi:MAG TPA: DUF4412 domain-containing protein [Cytophagaceae bacterium]|jgi:hypothetical protein|nr:DUF4412 domain-containing protein [Cytophagaceae bacterium]
MKIKKNIALLLCTVLLTMVQSMAQTFEGYIKYAFVVDLGAENSAKMAAASENMNTPEMKAQLDAMKQKMNDPEFKKMMDSNPQFKAQMEAMMAMSSTGNNDSPGKNSLLPKDIIISFKNGNSLYKMNGGTSVLVGDVLYLKDKDQSYQIFKERKTYKIVPKGEQKKSTAIVTKTGETLQLLGHPCTKYIVKDGETNMNIWATTDLKNLYDQMKKASVGKERNLYMEQIDGIPLKVERKSKDMRFTMEVIELKEQVQNSTDFAIPTDYTEEKVPETK